MENNINNTERLMGTKEIADYIGVHEMTVYRLVRNNKIPTFRVGGQIRTMKKVLDQWIENGCKNAMTK